MNRLIGKVIEIKSLKRLNLIKFQINSQIINVLMLEMNINLKVGKKAELLIKPTAVSVCNEKCNFENCIKGEIIDMKKGEILSSIVTEVEGYEIESIMLKEYSNFNNETVYLLFKANDVAVGEVFDES